MADGITRGNKGVGYWLIMILAAVMALIALPLIVGGDVPHYPRWLVVLCACRAGAAGYGRAAVPSVPLGRVAVCGDVCRNCGVGAGRSPG